MVPPPDEGGFAINQFLLSGIRTSLRINNRDGGSLFGQMPTLQFLAGLLQLDLQRIPMPWDSTKKTLELSPENIGSMNPPPRAFPLKRLLCGRFTTKSGYGDDSA
jgi:hypothetical protein